ncbi:hypothetical protein K490DRAFT_60447 [Saccharata proteae CBS 121410]|uniref:Uncharacterized protein n=1 Tax=Saccharata proteae CBS 121410 TaxID=1314787 RepID=A0A9P4HMW9_9PEZI|nr:hypothetical protein K490DRAFT_60447 [Saccharata proteae CBS 121410]
MSLPLRPSTHTRNNTDTSTIATPPRTRSPLTAHPIINNFDTRAAATPSPNFSRPSPPVFRPSTPANRTTTSGTIRSPRFPFSPNPINASPRRGVPDPIDTAAANAAIYASWPPPSTASPTSPVSRRVHDSYHAEDYATLSRFSTATEDQEDESYGHAQGAPVHPSAPPELLARDLSGEALTWAALLAWALRLVVLVSSIGVAVTAGSSLSSYGRSGAASIQFTSSSPLPSWPDLNLAPTYLFMATGFVGCCCTAVVAGLAARRRFGQEVRWLDGFRIAAGVFMVVVWAGAVAVERVFGAEKGGLQSLGGWACQNEDTGVEGAGFYSHVCEEQTAAFALANVSLGVEFLLLMCLAVDLVLLGQRRKDRHVNEKRAGKSRA